MDNSHFSRLPAELRMSIYEYVFTYDSGVICKSGYWTIRDPSSRRRAVAYHLGPTTVCKQWRKETLHLPLSLNTLVLGDEYHDVDQYYEWWVAHSTCMKDPCMWAIKALQRLPASFVSDATTFKLNLWIYPSMQGKHLMTDLEWRQMERAFGQLLRLVPGKLVVTIHFLFHYEVLRCDYEQGHMAMYGQTTIEIQRDDPDSWKERLLRAVEDRRRALCNHQFHDDTDKCRVRGCNDWLEMGSRVDDVEVLTGRLAAMMQSTYTAANYESDKE